MMREPRRFELEVGRGSLEPEVVVKRCGKFYVDKQVPGACDVKLSHPDGNPVINGRFYRGGPELVLLAGGILGPSSSVDRLFARARALLDAKAKGTLARSVFLLPNLFEAKRFGLLEPPAVADGGRDVEVASNFPLGGEGDADVAARGHQLLDPDQRRFPNLPPQHLIASEPNRTASVMLPEVRVLVRLFGCAKPSHFFLLHEAGEPEAGLFVYPRGGVETALDAVLAGAPSDADDELADRLLRAVASRLRGIDESLVKATLAGNRPTGSGFATVHGPLDVPRARGTHVTAWTSVPVARGSDSRDAARTLRLALPRALTSKKLKQEALAELWAEELVREIGAPP